MKMTFERNPRERIFRFHGELHFDEVNELSLDTLDRRVVEDINIATSAPADILLALEIIYRRFDEQQKEKARGQESEV